MSNGPAEPPKGTLAKAEPSESSVYIAEQLRRRRAAALRMAPLPSGYSDPLDELADAPGAGWVRPLCPHGRLPQSCRRCWELVA